MANNVNLICSSLARKLFSAHDDPLLKFNYDDNQRIEPEFYVPILPMVLVNGAEGIGTGWSTKIPNYDVREIVNNLRRMLDGQEPRPMVCCYTEELVAQCGVQYNFFLLVIWAL